MEGIEVYRRGHACRQSKIKMKILTTLSAPWQLDFPHPCFSLLTPPRSSFYTPHPSCSFHADLLPQTLGFLNLAVLVMDFTSSVLTHLGHPSHQFLASCRDELPSSHLLLALSPPTHCEKVPL